MAKTKVECPMCGEPAERIEKGGQVFILCEAEDAIYAMTPTGAKVKQRGRLDDIERRLAALEGKPAAEPTKDDKDDKDDKDNDDDENRPFLEITFGDDEDEEEDSEEADEDTE